MFENEKFALDCLAQYKYRGLIVDKSNGEFAHFPYPRDLGNSGAYLLHEDHQQHGLIQTKDFGRVCYFAGDVKRWLLTCEDFPEGFFDLWDVYDKYQKLNGSSLGLRMAKEKRGLYDPSHAEKIRATRSLNATNIPLEAKIRGGENGSSANKKKAGQVGGTKQPKEVKINNANKLNSQVWQSTVDGFISSAAGVAKHNRSLGYDSLARVQLK